MAGKMPQLSKEQQKNLICGVILAAVFCYVYWNYMLKPTLASINTSKTEIQELKDTIADAQMKAKRLPVLRKEYQALKKSMASAEKQLPKKQDLPGLLRLLTNEAMRFRVDIAQMVPTGISDQNFYQIFPIELTIESTFHNLGRFLTSLGTKERIISAENIRMTVGTIDGAKATIRSSVRVIAYVAKG